MITGSSRQQLIDASCASAEFSVLASTWQDELERRSATDALAHERSRIAADIHDLVMQDLAFALGTARTLADDAPAASVASTVVAAGERALAGARQILDALAAGERELAIEAVEDSVRTAARNVPLRFDAGGVPAGVQPDQPTLQALVHIAREAVTNAVKHADPFLIEAVFEHGDEWRLCVTDDGRGLGTNGGAGFGLLSMRHRAQALGGTLRVHSAAGAGTTVEAILP